MTKWGVEAKKEVTLNCKAIWSIERSGGRPWDRKERLASLVWSNMNRRLTMMRWGRPRRGRLDLSWREKLDRKYGWSIEEPTVRRTINSGGRTKEATGRTAVDHKWCGQPWGNQWAGQLALRGLLWTVDIKPFPATQGVIQSILSQKKFLKSLKRMTRQEIYYKI